MLSISNQPLVSIIIPTYNYGYLISETLDCLINQTYINWEAIIIDDGSTDNTKVLVQKYLSDIRVRYIYQINKGLSAARNAGISNASGKYITFLDADDFISQDKINVQVKYMEENSSSIITYTQAKYFKDKEFGVFYNTLELNNETSFHTLKKQECISDFIQKLIKSNFTPVNTPLIRASFIRERSLVFKTSLKALEDWDFWVRCAFSGANFHYIEDNNALAFIRVHQQSMSFDRVYMYDWELELRKLISIYIDESALMKNKDFIKINEKCSDILYRMNIRKHGLFNIRYFIHLFHEIGISRTLKLALKEANALRRNK